MDSTVKIGSETGFPKLCYMLLGRFFDLVRLSKKRQLPIEIVVWQDAVRMLLLEVGRESRGKVLSSPLYLKYLGSKSTTLVVRCACHITQLSR